jgi:hypothetical protein
MEKVAVKKGRQKGSKNKVVRRKVKPRNSMTPKRRKRHEIVPAGWRELFFMFIFQDIKWLYMYLKQTLASIKAKRLARKMRDFNEKD